jgi:hypothetical protein
MPSPEKKTQIVTLRFDKSELEDLNARALEVGLTRSAYIRRKLQGLPVLPARVPPLNGLAYEQLGQIARCLPAIRNNLNQIARAINTAKIQGEPIPDNLPSTEQLQRALVQIEELKTLMVEVGLQLLGVQS